MDQVRQISYLVLAVEIALPALSVVMRRHPRWRRLTGLILLAIYVYGNLQETILDRVPSAVPVVKPVLFWSYRASFSFQASGLEITSQPLLAEILLNILLYIPLGCLLPYTFPRLFSGKRAWLTVLTGALCSLLTEGAQYVFRIGWFEWDDIFNNTLGCVLGLMLYSLLSLTARHLADRGQGTEKEE